MDIGLALPIVGPGASPEAIHRLVTLPPSVSINYDPIETLTFVAARTSRIRLGTSVLLSLLHRPVHLGSRLATLDVLSGGRVIAGLGQPMMDQELVAAGVSPGRRGAGFQEFVQASGRCGARTRCASTGASTRSPSRTSAPSRSSPADRRSWSPQPRRPRSSGRRPWAWGLNPQLAP